jgi:endonuclease/exonuclease/phosphatase family metal-dependent hydrolase
MTSTLFALIVMLPSASPVASTEQSPSARPLQILSYNIHHGEGTDGKVDLARIAKVIAAQKPDLVALQEVDRGTRRTDGVDQTAELARLTGLHGAFGRAIDYEGGEYGQAILSRAPILKTRLHILPGVPDRERRIAFEAVVMLDGREVSFVTTHLHHRSEKFRIEQAERLNEVFVPPSRPVFLAGDLNALPDSPPLKVLRKDWIVLTDDPSLKTFPSSRPTKHLDYILAKTGRPPRVVQQAVIDDSAASDHRPILVILELADE